MDEPLRRWPMFHLVEKRARLLEDMFDATGASTIEAVRYDQGAGFRQARATCIICPHARDCRRWLDGEASASPSPAAVVIPGFCPNAGFIESCRRPS